MKVWMDTSTGETGYVESLVIFDIPSYEDADAYFDLIGKVDEATRYNISWLFGKDIYAN